MNKNIEVELLWDDEGQRLHLYEQGEPGDIPQSMDIWLNEKDALLLLEQLKIWKSYNGIV